MKRRNALVQYTLALSIGTMLALCAITTFAQDMDVPPSFTPVKLERLGRWLTESGNLEVDIAPCDHALCGTVVRVLANRPMGKSGTEMTPVDTRPVLGMQLMSGFTQTGDSEWDGRIYNRENGKTYRCLISLVNPEQLQVRAYVGLPLFGKTQIWRRVADPVDKPWPR